MSEPVVKVAPWEDVALRTIAIYKLTKAALVLTLGLTLMNLVHHDVVQFLRDYVFGPLRLESDFDSDSENRFLAVIYEQASKLTPHRILMSGWACFFYAAVFTLEGVGLYLKKHWAEYMVLIVTGSFLPFEAWILYHHWTWWKVLLIIGNLLIMVYLTHRILLDAKRKAQLAATELPPIDPKKKISVVTSAA